MVRDQSFATFPTLLVSHWSLPLIQENMVQHQSLMLKILMLKIVSSNLLGAIFAMNFPTEESNSDSNKNSTPE
jgi:hypothetical protein